MAKSYVEFEAPKEIADKSLEALRLAKQSGSVKKGVNEVTKSIERGLATLVLLAGDVEPEEVVMHIPTLCKQKKIAIVFVPAKLDLGKAVGLNVPCAAASIEKAGEGAAQLKEVTTWSVRMMGGKPEEKSEAKPEHKEHKKEEKAEKTE
jgi:large subunit ribosomal protein L7Ae